MSRRVTSAYLGGAVITEGARGPVGPREGAATVDTDRITIDKHALFPASFYANGTQTRSVNSRPLGVVIDLTGDEPIVDMDSRPWLGDDAGLLAASDRRLKVKRVVAVITSVVALLMLSPLFLLTAMAIKLTSSGPVFFKQKRAGKGGREFDFYKFRTMEVGAEDERDDLIDLNEVSGPVFKIKDDPRMTSIGKFLRRTSIDELPQLWNVLRGDMCLVGPRPLPVMEAEACSDWERQRLLATQGITCIWQVSGRCELDFETWVKMDIEYIRNWSLWLDLKLLAKTLPAVLSGRGAY